MSCSRLNKLHHVQLISNTASILAQCVFALYCTNMDPSKRLASFYGEIGSRSEQAPSPRFMRATSEVSISRDPITPVACCSYLGLYVE